MTAIHAGTDLDDFTSLTVRRAAIRAHEPVVAAIRAQDTGAARRRTLRHVHAFHTQDMANSPAID